MFEGMSEWYEALVQCPSMYVQKKHHVLWRKGPRNIRTAFLRTQIEVRDTLILAESILVQPVVAFICRQGCGIRGGNEAEACQTLSRHRNKATWPQTKLACFPAWVDIPGTCGFDLGPVRIRLLPIVKRKKCWKGCQNQ